MRINTNVAALNSYNQLKNTQGNLSKSLSKLSSGKRINGAADDAAGLAISEKMSSQVRGLSQAQRNAQDGISMIQTAEGALKESHSILQRMRELSVQAANDTNTAADRGEIQKEVDQLSQELSRIGKTTEFNTQKLLDGSLEDTKFQIGANEKQNMSVSVSDMRGNALGTTGEIKSEIEASTVDNTDGDFGEGTYTYDGSELLDSDGNTVVASGDVDTSAGISFTFSGGNDSIEFDQNLEAGDEIEVYDDDGTLKAKATANFDNDGLEAGDYSIDEDNGELLDSNGDVVATSTDNIAFDNADGETVLSLDQATTTDMDISVGGLDVSDQSAANDAIKTLDSAISKVSEERSKLGSAQNRLDHTINNLNTAQENLTAAESRISDVDMAKEMMDFTKSQILSQAGTAMMAQANQLPQGVLQLLG